jgi:hypothetical protein
MRRGLAMLLAMGAMLQGLPGAAADLETYRKTAGDYTVYLTVMPAEMILGPRAEQVPGASPQRAPALRDTHHVIVAIFDTRSGQSASGMDVKARVAALGFSGEKRALEPVRLGAGAAYGNSFPMLGRGPFRVDVEFRSRYGPHEQQATFYFTHPSFAAPGTGKGETR